MTSPANDSNDITKSITSGCEAMNSMLSNYVNAATQSQSITWQGIDDIAKNMNSLMQETYARAISACKTIMSAKSPQEAAESQSEFFKDCFDGIVASHGKMSEISLRTAKGAIEPLTQHANDAMGSLMKKASVSAA
ncbi:MAG: phasin family protein [Alphaproteobacteria bacterium]|nr:phasin family protein [Alphaproteobacteria bacterium]